MSKSPPAAWVRERFWTDMAGVCAAFRFAIDLIGARNFRRAFEVPKPAEPSAGFFFSHARILIAKTGIHLGSSPRVCLCGIRLARRADRSSTASLGQQSTFSPADFWYAPSAARVFIPALRPPVGIETDAGEMTLHGFDIGGAQLGRG